MAEIQSDDNQFLTFTLGSEIFGVEILQVKEILDYRDPTRVPRTPAFISGVINLRGSVVPVVDVYFLFSGKAATIAKRTCIVIIEVENEGIITDIGILVDSVNEVIDIPPENREAAPSFGAKIRTDFILGMGKIEDKIIILLDMTVVLTFDDLGALTQLYPDLQNLVEEKRNEIEQQNESKVESMDTDSASEKILEPPK